jgi:hypothetical protein
MILAPVRKRARTVEPKAGPNNSAKESALALSSNLPKSLILFDDFEEQGSKLLDFWLTFGRF